MSKILLARVSILGTTYTIFTDNSADDERLEGADGYSDWTTKRIVIWDGKGYSNLGDVEKYRNKVLRHEIIHAFVFESGLHEVATFDDEHFEQMVDWIAIQFHKIKEVFNELKI